MTKSKFKTKYGEIVYYRMGEGNKLLVFLHGFLGRPFFLETLHEKFGPKGYSIVAPVLPGHGRSFPIPSGFSFNDLYSCVHEWLGFLKAEEISVVGHSIGGALSWKLGHEEKLPISKVVLLSPGLGKFRPRNLDYVFRFALDLQFDYPRTWFINKS